MSKISELSDGGSLQSTDYLIAVRSGGNVKVQPNGTVTGTTGSFSGNVTFADNAKAIFGAGSDLQIYHDGSHARLRETTGDFRIQTTSSGVNALVAKQNAEVELYHAGSEKLATTATGIDVTGTVTADGLTVEAPSVLATLHSTSTNSGLQFTNGSTNAGVRNWHIRTNSLGFGDFVIRRESAYGSGIDTPSFKIDANGDISFYEDTGTTPKFFWDASAESLGIGTSSPAEKLQINDGRLRFLESGQRQYNIGVASGTPDFQIYDATFSYAPFTLDGSGNVGIGTSSPLSKLNVKGTQGNWRVDPDSVSGEIQVLSTTTANDGFRDFRLRADEVIVDTAGTERMRLDSAGNLGLGVTPSAWSSAVKAYQVGNSSLVGTSTQMLLSQNYFFDGADKYISNGPASQYYQVSGSHQWRIAPSGTAGNAISFTQAMTLDASGNLLVGKTSVGSIADTVTGVTNYGIGLIRSVRDGNLAALFQRNTSDGAIVEFNKDGSTVGSIGSYSGTYLTAGSNAAGLAFIDAGSPFSIRPHNISTNAPNDAALDLGASSARWNNLYLSGGVYLGGTGAANLLDDYEEGTWTPTVTGSTTAGSYSGAVAFGKYTKVGNLVCVTAYFYGASGTGSGDMVVGGFPFASSSEAATAIQYNSGLDLPTGTHTPMLLFNSGTSGEIRCSSDSTASYSLMPYPSVVGYLRFSLTYQTT